MPGNARKLVRVTKFLVAGVCVFCVSWIACVGDWHAGGWRAGPAEGLSTMRTIVGYSAGKLAELDRPTPVTCDRLPAFPDIPKINRTWSEETPPTPTWQQVPRTRVLLYAAFYDMRTPQRYIRILATFHGRNYSTEEALFCQTRPLNSDEDTVEVVAAKPLEIWWHGWDTSSVDVETPMLLSCPLTEPLNGPSVVSVVTEPCDNPSNAFVVEPNQRNSYERMFTICVKDMLFDKDISENLIEWIETNKILGVDKIDVYVDELSADSKKVLSHYRDMGYVRLYHVPIKNKPGRTLWQRRRDHIVTYNDCLYRNIGESEYIAPLDVDEIILPKIAYTWPELLSRLKKRGWDSSQNSAILVQNVFFFEFLQGIEHYTKLATNKRKVYIKRDDVRIEERNIITEVELVNDVDKLIDNRHIDDKYVDKILKEEYKNRCGQELPVPKLAKHIISSATVSPIGYYSKSFMVTKKVLTAFNHYPLANLAPAGFAGWSAPFDEVQLNHYKESCNSTVVPECARYGRRARFDPAALRLRSDLTRALANAICYTNTINNP